MSSEQLLRLDDAAQWLAVSRRTLQRLVASGEVSYVKVGKCTRFRRDDITEYIERQHRKAAS